MQLLKGFWIVNGRFEFKFGSGHCGACICIDLKVDATDFCSDLNGGYLDLVLELSYFDSSAFKIRWT